MDGLFGGLAQLGERLAGSQKVAGSSPVSSTRQAVGPTQDGFAFSQFCPSCMLPDYGLLAPRCNWLRSNSLTRLLTATSIDSSFIKNDLAGSVRRLLDSHRESVQCSLPLLKLLPSMVDFQQYRLKRFLIAILLGMLMVEQAAAAPNWWDRLWGEDSNALKDDAELTEVCQLTDEQGPWMIMALAFRGPSAIDDASQTVRELRQKHKLAAYIHQKTYDFSDSFVGRGVDRFGNPRRMRHQQNTSFEEVAILIGNYASVDDPQAQRDLNKIKSLTLNSIQKEDKKKSRSFAELRRIHNEILKKENANPGGVMKLAFITTNPILPEEYFRPQGVDRFVAQLNDNIEHSLLECPREFTVKVATFTGLAAVHPKHIEEIETKGMKSSRLEKGAIKAHRLTIALRAKGYEAYQFHDRKQSIVTVGSFAQPEKVDQEGRFVYTSEVQDLLQRFSAKRQGSISGVQHPGLQTGILPETLLGIPFDIQPVLIPVPQRSVSSDFAQRSFSAP